MNIYACVYNEPYETERPEFIASSLDKAKGWCTSGRPMYSRGVTSYCIIELELDATTDAAGHKTWGWHWQSETWREYGPNWDIEVQS